jgi:NAD(P)-dependent dehydrogenase (short-subunit alcohol dehydrogenase family)
VITGAARGLGRACAVRFAQEGVDLVLVDVTRDIAGVPYKLGTESQLSYTAELCRRHGVAAVIAPGDVRSMQAIEDIAAMAVNRFGQIDILVNNAGIAAPSGKMVHEITEDEWHLMVDIDLSGSWRMIRAFGKFMLQRRAGSIINVASTAGLVGYRNFAGYVSAKHGMIGLTRAAALDYAPFQVRVNALCPGSVRDDRQVEGCMLSEIARSLDVPMSEHEELFVQVQPMNALIEPESIAGAAVWLASDDALQVTGSVLTVDGGFTVR